MNKDKKLKVIVSCSGKFHAFALAEQLERHGSLEKLYTSYSSIKNPLAKNLVSRRDKENIPKSMIATFLPIAFGLKVINKPWFWNDLFDRWVAWKVQKSDADVFIGWSGMSLHSIRVAKAKGMLTILERGSSHIKYQNELLMEEFAKFNKSFFINPKVIEKEVNEYRESDCISIPSYFVKHSFIEKGIETNKLIKNNYGTSNFFKTANPISSDSKFRILYLGTSNIRKGLIYFYDAISRLNIPQEDFEVWIIGKINPEMKQVIKDYKNKNWKFFGHINHYDLPKYISSCKVAVHPSIEEGLSMVIPQILSCGVPVIASTNSGGEDIITDGETGFIVPIRDSNAIKEKIDMLFKDRELLRNMKENCVTQSLDLSWDAYGNRYIDNIEKVLN